MPLSSDFFSNTLDYFSDCFSSKDCISVLFELLNEPAYNARNNALILKNIIPLLLNENECYQLNYIYIDKNLYDNHLAIYPYYIILSDKAILLDSNLSNYAIIDDKKTIETMIGLHMDNLKTTRKFKTVKVDLTDSINHLIDNHISNNDMYAISYEPCISSFVPPNMFDELIDDDYPNKAEFLNLINKRLEKIMRISKKYTLFNKDSIMEFAHSGNILPYKHPSLKMCTLEQRKIILQNILNYMDGKNVIFRAFSADEINISHNFELNDIQNYYETSIHIFSDTKPLRLINIKEPIISKCFIDFINDIVDTHKTFSSDETKELIVDAISEIDNMIANNVKI